MAAREQRRLRLPCSRARLSDRAGELGDPCAAIMTTVELSPGGTDEIVFVLGQAGTTEEARRLAVAYANPARAGRHWRKFRRCGIASSEPSECVRLIPRLT